MASPIQDSLQSRQTTTVGFGEILRNRDFLFLWSGQIFSQLADKIYLVFMIALIAVAFNAANNVSSLASGIMIASTIPAVLFGSLAGVFVDRWPKRAVLVSSNVLRGLFILALPFLPSDYMVLLALTFIVSTVTQFFAPAETAVIPLIVSKQGLLSANSLFTTTMMASVVVGFAIGEPTLSLFGGVESGHWVVGGAYLIAALLLSFMRTGETAARAGKSQGDARVLQDLKEGFDYIRRDPGVRAALIQLVLLYSIFAALSVLAISLAAEVGLKQQQFGFLLAGAGVGLVIGAAGVGQFGNRVERSMLALVGSLVLAVVLIALAWVNNLWAALSLTLVLGIAAACMGVPMQTLIQEETPEQVRGKVFGLQNNLVNIALSLPLALAGIAADNLGLRPVILSLGLSVIVVGLLTRSLFKKKKLPLPE